VSESPADEVRAVTEGRVLAVLRSQGYRVTEVADGAVAGTWGAHAFTIALVGESADILQVRGTWHDTLEVQSEASLRQMLNDWNRDRIWPKVYTRSSNEGLRIQAETCFDLADGANDAQLVEVIACGLGTGLQFFEAMNGLLR
jgi:hypothetical protein